MTSRPGTGTPLTFFLQYLLIRRTRVRILCMDRLGALTEGGKSFGVKRREIYCKRPILWLSSCNIMTPHPLTAGRVCIPRLIILQEANPMAGVFQNIDPHPLTAGRVCIPRLWCGGRSYWLGGEGGGGSLYCKTQLCTQHT